MVSHTYLWNALKSKGINSKFVGIIQNLNRNSTAYVKTDKKQVSFPIEREVRK